MEMVRDYAARHALRKPTAEWLTASPVTAAYAGS